ncbi:MAG: hypothetical protein F6K17_42455 [Okeania sp. SIO3C4]|nr:hypothetical protein [Okeania sp. SIO3B3]NER08723.1 hypothetical protein [Okeania sp. SIO3C4]
MSNYTPSVGANGRSPLLDIVILRKSCFTSTAILYQIRLIAHRIWLYSICL